MTSRILALWLLMLGIASGGFLLSWSQERTLKMTRVFLAYCAVASTVQLAFWFLWPGVYYKAYWTLEVAHNLLLCFLSAEIVWPLLPRRYAIPWIGIAFAIPAIPLLVRLPLKPRAAALLHISTSASFAGGILLTTLFFMSVKWTKERRIATAGVVSILIGDLLSSLGISDHSGPGQISMVQLAPLIGLILLSLAGRSKQKDKLAYGDAGQESPPKSKSAWGGNAA